MDQDQIKQTKNQQLQEILEMAKNPPLIQVALSIKLENMNQNQIEIVHISNLIPKIEQLTQFIKEDLKNQKIKQFFINLQKNFHLIQIGLQQDIKIPINLIITNLINIGIFYSKIGLTNEAILTFEFTIQQIIKNKKQIINDLLLQKNENQNKFIEKMKLKMTQLKLHIQCCVLLSEIQLHEVIFQKRKHFGTPASLVSFQKIYL